MRSQLNHFLYRFKYNYGRKLLLQKPVDVSLELSSFCNMRCGYCYHANQDNLPFETGRMSKETAFKIIDNAAALGVHSLKFNWKGESTLNPHYAEIVKRAASHRRGSTFIELIANTNFMFQPKADIFEGLSQLTKLKISYDSFRPEVFENQRIRGKHDVITSNIDHFHNYYKKLDTEMVIQAVRTDANADEDLESEIKKRWPLATISIRDMVAGRNEETTEGFKELSEKRVPCKQAYVRLIFNWKGEAYACCPDIKEQLYLGSIHKENISEIFNGKRAQSLRKRLDNGRAFLADPCKSCSSYESYDGYKANWNS